MVGSLGVYLLEPQNWALSDIKASRNVCFELLEGCSLKHANSCITGFEPIISTENRYHKKKNVFAAAEPFVGEPWRQRGRVQLDPSSVSTLEMLVLPGYLMSGHSQPVELGAAVTWHTLSRACPWHSCWRATCQGWMSLEPSFSLGGGCHLSWESHEVPAPH